MSRELSKRIAKLEARRLPGLSPVCIVISTGEALASKVWKVALYRSLLARRPEPLLIFSRADYDTKRLLGRTA